MGGLTPSQTVGPFFSIGLAPSPRLAEDGDVRLEGAVYDGAGDPVPDAVVEVWQADRGLWGRCLTDSEGRFAFVTVKPAAAGGQAPHLELAVFARGLLRQVVTRVYFPDEAEANAADPVLALAGASLVARADGGVLRFDVHLQGERQTAFFDL